MKIKRVEKEDRLTIKPQSKYFPDEYPSHILKIEKRGWRVAIPNDHNQPVLLGIGTSVEIEMEDLSYQAEILEKDLEKGSYLITKPRGSTLHEKKKAQVIAISSGKGGVGKSTIVANLGILLSMHGERVSIIDADLGTANLDILLNIPTEYNVSHVIRGEKRLLDIAAEGPRDILLIPGGSGLVELTRLKDWQFSQLIESFSELEAYSDYIFIDTSAGLGADSTNFLLAADKIIIITTPEPHSITDAYAIIKVVTEDGRDLDIKLIINQVESLKEGRAIGRRIKQVVKKYLSLEIEYLGSLHWDPYVQKAIKKQESFLLSFPSCKASKDIEAIVHSLSEKSGIREEERSRGIPFIKRLKALFSLKN